jgi:predicted DNA-binding transcriptional regulator AlpA
MSKQSIKIPVALQNFDSLPDSAEVRLPIVCGWRGSSSSTVWRDVKAGRLPSPRKHSPRCTTWNVGELRAAKMRTAKEGVK